MINITANVQAGRAAYHRRLFKEFYEESLKEFSEEGVNIGKDYREQKISAEDFLERYSLSFRNIFRLMDLTLNTETEAKYAAAKDIVTFNRIKKNLEDLN